jgi:ligand-binding sensor domain-containing protein
MTSFKKHIFSFFLVCLHLIVLPSYAQQYSYRQYSTENGLSSSEVYQAFQDSKGYVWFATDMGVSRFDGNSFTNFDVSNGLPTNTIFEIFEDHHGKIWFLGMGNKLSYFYNDTIQQYNNPAIKKFAQNSKLSIKRSLYIDSIDNIYFSVMNRGIFKISANGKSINLQANDKNSTLRIINLPKKLLIGHTLTNKSFEQIIFDFAKNKKYSIQNPPTYLSAGTLNFIEFCPDSNSVVFTCRENIYKLEADKITMLKNFKNEIIWFSRDKTGKYWVSIRSKGIFCYKDVQFNKPPVEVFLPKKSVSSIIIDKEGGYWFSTLNNGVYHLSNHSLKIIKETKNRNILDLCRNDDKLIISTDLNELLIFDNKQQLEKTIVLDKYFLANRILFDPKLNSFWLGTYVYLHSLKNNKFIKHTYIERAKITKEFGRRSIQSMALAPVSGIWLGTHAGINFIDKNRLLYHSLKEDAWKEIVYDIICNKDGSLWLGTFSGLWKYTNGEYIQFAKQNPLFKLRINTLLKHDGKLYAGTNGSGLLIYDLNDQSVRQIQKSNGLSNNTITDIISYKNSLWLSTNKGISIINDINKANYSINKIKKSNGLLSNEIKRLFLHDSILYIAGKKGVNYLNINSFSLNSNLLNTNIENFTVSNRDTTIKKSYQLGYQQNNIRISYKAISFKTEDIQYRYKLKPVSTNWVYTNKDEIQFTALPPGVYKFIVSAKNQNGQWNKQASKIEFTIDAPFWQNQWFIAITVILLSIIIFVSINYKLHQVKKENLLKKELNLYMKKAINAQINPHFLYNSLNSINQYILKNDRINSSKYLNRFSTYMRSILNALKNDMQSLSEELKISELYLELEKLRLKEKLTYSLTVDQSIISKNILIPTMIITPFLENAIWFGILPKKGQGKIDIKVFPKGQNLIISVKDNGIGHTESLKLQEKPDFKPNNPGAENTLERIKLLNKLYQDIIKIEYLDINEEENIRGTIVNIIIRLERS